jgi:hypothetical protein
MWWLNIYHTVVNVTKRVNVLVVGVGLKMHQELVHKDGNHSISVFVKDFSLHHTGGAHGVSHGG